MPEEQKEARTVPKTVDYAKMAEELGLQTGEIQARTQEVIGILLGWKDTQTKDGRPMYELSFLVEDGSVATINMMSSADRGKLKTGEQFAARWLGNEFTIVPGAEFVETDDGDLVVVDGETF
jgi:hypothetical protein